MKNRRMMRKWVFALCFLMGQITFAQTVFGKWKTIDDRDGTEEVRRFLHATGAGDVWVMLNVRCGRRSPARGLCKPFVDFT